MSLHGNFVAFLCSTTLLLPNSGLCGGATGYTYIYNAPESAGDRRYLYHWKILETALEMTREKFGAYDLRAAQPMSENRQAFELRQASGRITVMYLDTVPEFERDLVPVRIPVDKDLGGYRVFLIRHEDREKFAHVTTLEELRRLKYGLGLGWVDVEILRQNRFNVVTGSSYEGLFEMLVHRRFDVFLRGAVEVIDEYEQRKSQFPDLEIEQSILLFYPLPMYFWFSKTDEGRRLAARAEFGMRTMLADGTYDRIFSEYQDAKIERLRLKDRRLFRIENPFLGVETPLADRRLWFDPQTYRNTRSIP